MGDTGDTGLLTVNAPLNPNALGALANITNLSLLSGSGGISIPNAIMIPTSGTLTLNSSGTVTQSAAIAAANLELLGSGGSYTLTNTSNSVGTLAANTGSVNFNDNGSLTVGSSGGISGTSGVTGSGPITLTASGNLTIDSGDSVNSTGNNVVLAATGNFINNDGSNAVTAGAGRWLIYSNNPADDTFDNLNSNNSFIWGTTYPMPISAAGDRYVFAVQPTVIIAPPTSGGGSTGGTTITFQPATAQAPSLTTGCLPVR